MKKLLFILCAACLITTAKAQQYTIAGDTSICRITITKGNGLEYYMFLAGDAKYVDSQDQIMIFDDRMNFRGYNLQIVSHPSIAALKTDLDIWIAACQ